MRPRVVLGFSGGVDSAVTARLLTMQGWDVRCVYLETGSGEGGYARESAQRMGLPFEEIDARAALESEVCAPFEAAYLAGATPSPCVLCNRRVKLKLLCEAADALGIERIATGHYAAARAGAIFRGRPENDQSYMLCLVTRSQACRLVLPLGGYAKREVREMAADFGLMQAQKPDSMEICFIKDGDFAAWIESRGHAPGEGALIYNGERVGTHGGVHRYTLGQRRGLGFAAGRRVFVSEIRPDTNEVVLADGDGLYETHIRTGAANWLINAPRGEFSCLVRVRHSRDLTPARARAAEDGTLDISFERPVRAPAPGQAAALYAGDMLIAGGIIAGK